MGSRVVPRVLAGQKIRTIGDVDVIHTWTYVEDVARALVVLGRDERAWGRAWHVPSGPARTQRQMVGALADAAGVPAPPVVSIPPWLLRAVGTVVPTVGELEEVRYQFDRPFVMDSSDFSATFGLAATPLDEAARDTVRWWRSRTETGVTVAG
jgi:nucleoside-diphosphate-sugar epimerase